jgi:uncharacterized lipoprotein NlpE involved in copper resistance
MNTLKSLKAGIHFAVFCAGLLLVSCSGSVTPHKTKEVPQEIGELPVVYSGSIIFSEEASAHSEVELFADSTFLLLRRINNDTTWNGVFGNWFINSSGKLVLDAGRDAQLILGVMESSMVILNSEGERVERSEQFVLRKLTGSTLSNRSFTAHGEYFYMADAAIMKFCGTGDKVWPVAASGDNLSAERLFLQEKSLNPDEKVFVEAIISIVVMDNMEGNIRPHVLIHSLLGRSWMLDCM